MYRFLADFCSFFPKNYNIYSKPPVLEFIFGGVLGIFGGKLGDVDCCFGGKYGQKWVILPVFGVFLGVFGLDPQK